MTLYAHITGWGTALPNKILTNDELAKTVETDDEWIRSRTGIRERRIADAEQSTASLAAEAALNALRMANIPPAKVELIIVSTSSPEHVFPSTASLVQDAIGAVNAGAFDLSAACTGFIYALNMATQAIRSGSIKCAIVVGAETLSRYVDWKDRNTCILFGDGAGAFVLQASEQPGGVISSVLHSDGSGGDLLSLPAGGSKLPASLETVQNGQHFIQMNGREVFRFATRVMAQATQEALQQAGWRVEDLHLVVPHQANQRIIEAAAKGLKLPMEKFVVNLERFGNTSTASIPLAVCEAAHDGRLRRGDKLVLVGFGAGLTWGAVSLIWAGPLPVTDRTIPIKPYLRFSRLRSWVRRFIRHLEGKWWGRRNNGE